VVANQQYILGVSVANPLVAFDTDTHDYLVQRKKKKEENIY
jgi:hypothetical protein